MDIPGLPNGSSPGEHPETAGQRTADPAGADPAGADQSTAVEVSRPRKPAEAESGKPRKLLYVTLPGCWAR